MVGQIGLVDMLKEEYGIVPAGMLGHSAGGQGFPLHSAQHICHTPLYFSMSSSCSWAASSHHCSQLVGKKALLCCC